MGPSTGSKADPIKIIIMSILTEKDAAKLLSLSARTLLRLRRAGEIGFYQLASRRVGYSAEHLQDFLKRHEQGILALSSHAEASHNSGSATLPNA